MSATVRLQPVYSWKGVLKLFSCIAAHTSSKPKGNRNLFSSPLTCSLVQPAHLGETSHAGFLRIVFNVLTPAFPLFTYEGKQPAHTVGFLGASGYIPGILLRTKNGNFVCFERQHSCCLFCLFYNAEISPSHAFCFLCSVETELSSDSLCALSRHHLLPLYCGSLYFVNAFGWVGEMLNITLTLDSTVRAGQNSSAFESNTDSQAGDSNVFLWLVHSDLSSLFSLGLLPSQ